MDKLPNNGEHAFIPMETYKQLKQSQETLDKTVVEIKEQLEGIHFCSSNSLYGNNGSCYPPSKLYYNAIYFTKDEGFETIKEIIKSLSLEKDELKQKVYELTNQNEELKKDKTALFFIKRKWWYKFFKFINFLFGI
jgi:hypothetical protein